MSPQYGAETTVIYVSGTFGTNSAIWKSIDNGHTFSLPQVSCDPDTLTPFTINQFTVVDDNTLVAGSYNGANGLIYRTSDSGLTYSHKAVLGTSAINSIAVSPDFIHDNTIIVGNRNGWIFRTTDSGLSFSALPSDAAAAPLSGNVTVAFDSDFVHDSIVFAASDTSGKGISRLTVGKSSRWENIDSTLPASSLINQMYLSAAGIIYAANAKAGGGIERCINPTSSTTAFETVICNLDATARLNGLWSSGSRLWSVDTANIRLMTFLDTLSSPVVIDFPLPDAGGIETKNAMLSWEPLTGAASYKWQVDSDADFSGIPSGFEGTTSGTSAHLPSLDPGTTYYSRVQCISPVSSIWSSTRSFTTVLSGSVTAPDLSSPGSGVTVSVTPVFEWGQLAGAEKYELVIATDAAFNNQVVQKTGSNALPSTAWQCDITLQMGTTYYWKVRAVSSQSFSAWSRVGIFITKSLPVATTSTTEPPVTLNVQVVLDSPLPAAGGIETKNAILSWELLAGSTNYKWQSIRPLIFLRYLQVLREQLQRPQPIYLH